MQITLRKAKKIQASIQTAIAAEDGKLTTRLELSVLRPTEDVQPTILKTREALRTRIETLIRLDNILLNLRLAVDRKNHESGLNDLVTEQANLRSREKRFVRLINGVATDLPDLTTMVNEFQATKAAYERVTDGYGGTREYNAVTIDPELLNALRVAHTEVKRRISDFQEKLDGDNSRLTIEFSDEDYAYLTAALII